MSNSVLCTAYDDKWVHARCTDKKKVTVYLAKDVRSVRRHGKEFEGTDEIQCDGVESVNKFSYLGDGLNATGGYETAVTARTKIGWMKFRVKGNRFSLKMKGKV